MCRVALRSCTLGMLRGAAASRGAPASRSLRSVFTAAARRGGSGSSSGRLASLRPVQASLAAAEQQADAADGAAGMTSLAAGGVLEPQLTWPGRTHGCGTLTEAEVGWAGGGAVPG